TQFDVPEGFLPDQSTRKEVYDFIISEITTNLPLLSETNDGTTYGRFNQWAAYALLAKMYQQAEVYTGTPAWAECIEAADKVINSGLFSLEAVQSSVFAIDNALSKEIVFAIPFDNLFTPDGSTAWTM